MQDACVSALIQAFCFSSIALGAWGSTAVRMWTAARALCRALGAVPRETQSHFAPGWQAQFNETERHSCTCARGRPRGVSLAPWEGSEPSAKAGRALCHSSAASKPMNRWALRWNGITLLFPHVRRLSAPLRDASRIGAANPNRWKREGV